LPDAFFVYALWVITLKDINILVFLIEARDIPCMVGVESCCYVISTNVNWPIGFLEVPGLRLQIAHPETGTNGKFERCPDSSLGFK
jgi:hypothetical protein